MMNSAGGILYKDGRILLGKRAANREFYPNVWDVIGGHCLPDEEPEYTLIRELKEEINITPIVFNKLDTLNESQPHLYGEREYHIYIVTDWIGEGPKMLGEEHSEIRWLTIEEALTLDLAHPKYIELFKTMRK